MIFGYARVSKEQQNLDRQIEMLRQHGIDELFEEKRTGTLASRPELTRMLDKVRAGDTVVVESFSRLARSTKNLLELVERFEKANVKLVSIKESFDTTTANGKMLLGVLATLSQFERDLVAERTKEGLEAARARGRKGGRRKTSSAKLEKAAKYYHTQQFTVEQIRELTGVTRNVLYRYLREQQTGALRKVGQKK